MSTRQTSSQFNREVEPFRRRFVQVCLQSVFSLTV